MFPTQVKLLSLWMKCDSKEALWWHQYMFKWLWQGHRMRRVDCQLKHALGQLWPTSPHVLLFCLPATSGVYDSEMSMLVSSLTRWSLVLAQWHKHVCQTVTLFQMVLTLLEDTSKPHQCSIPVLIYASDREYQSECWTYSHTLTLQLV